MALEKRSYYIRKFGTDGFRIGFKPTLKKLVGDRRAALGDEEVFRAVRSAVKQESERGRVVPLHPFPADGAEIPDTPKLTLVVLDPNVAWEPDGEIRKTLGEWTRARGNSPRLYPAALVWLLRKPGRALREKAEIWLASWKRVEADLASGALGAEYDRSERGEIARQIKDAEEGLKDEVWASYRYAIVADSQGEDGVREIDLGAGHSSAAASISARVVAALKAEGLLNEEVEAGYIERNWPTALKESGVWPLKGLRQSFLDGSLTRLPDPEEVLRRQIVGFVERGEFGLGSGLKPDATYERVWWKDRIGPEEVLFDDKTFLLTRSRASSLKEAPQEPTPAPPPEPGELTLRPPPGPSTEELAGGETIRLSIRGAIPPEQWNRLGTKLLPKLRSGGHDLNLNLDASLTVRTADVRHLEAELRQALRDLGLEGLVRIEKK